MSIKIAESGMSPVEGVGSTSGGGSGGGSKASEPESSFFSDKKNVMKLMMLVNQMSGKLSEKPPVPDFRRGGIATEGSKKKNSDNDWIREFLNTVEFI